MSFTYEIAKRALNIQANKILHITIDEIYKQKRLI